MSKVESSTACASRLLMFILLGSFSDTSVVVSIFHIVSDCHLWLVLRSWGGGGVERGVIDSSYSNYGFFLAWGWPFQGIGGGWWAVSGVGGSAPAHLAFRGLSC